MNKIGHAAAPAAQANMDHCSGNMVRQQNTEEQNTKDQDNEDLSIMHTDHRSSQSALCHKKSFSHN